MSDDNEYSYQVRIVVRDPRGKAWAPTNTTVEESVNAAIWGELTGDIKDDLAGLSVTVTSERLDK